ncbi:thiamine phosphate synthase [Aquibaculum arenosum]|uniref:Thiamine phosphate synthase n=1 Tax=Aquibaculum arenosum TaxID=3032591 RepID=A0ABT5YRM6_9PROT|nr:thiamine phosphate synthase [Fodinicurvata sp. CAU 1616]MDF2096864.1 thiamine phosphate synthase [Fodinicurvata sp. CAU 1616]
MASAPHCRLCLVTPPELVSGGLAIEHFLESFAAAFTGGDVAAVILSGASSAEAPPVTLIEPLRDIAQAADAAFLLQSDVDAAASYHCDGVLVAAEPASIRAARSRLGSQYIVGADCGTSRHAAMIAGEEDCDFVVLDAGDPELLAWWAELMELPCVAWGRVTLENAPALIATGIEFLAVGDAVWNHPEGPKAGVSAFNALCAAAVPPGS